jgi:hypothetical protein
MVSSSIALKTITRSLAFHILKGTSIKETSNDGRRVRTIRS